MTTSGTTSFSLNRDQISTQALNLLGVYGQGDTATSNDLSFCATALNLMVKTWEAQGIHLWTYTEAALFLTYGQQKYSLSSTSSDIAGDYPVFATLASNGSGTAITITTPNSSNNNPINGMNVNDNIGIMLDSNTIQWTTISSLTAPNIVNLNASLTGSASAGNNVFVFTTRTDRPLEITSARFRYSSGVERPFNKKGRDDYMKLPNKTTTGKANQYYYAPKVNDSFFYMWPTADYVGDCITFSYLRRIQDFDNPTDTPDLPQEWLEPIIYNLAVRIAPGFGIPLSKVDPDLATMARDSLLLMQLWDSEEGSLNMVPNYLYDY